MCINDVGMNGLTRCRFCNHTESILIGFAVFFLFVVIFDSSLIYVLHL